MTLYAPVRIKRHRLPGVMQLFFTLTLEYSIFNGIRNLEINFGSQTISLTFTEEQIEAFLKMLQEVVDHPCG